MSRALRLTNNNRSDSEDLVSQTYLYAWRSYGTFDHRFVKAWLMMILLNTFRNKYRKRQREPEVLGDELFAFDGFVSSVGMTTGSAEDEAIANMPDHQVRDALSRINPRHARILYLVEIEGWKYREVAEMLGIELGTVMSSIYRAKAAMRMELAKVNFEYIV